MISNQTDYKFIYHKDLFKNTPKVELKEGTININKLLKNSVSSFNVDINKDNTIVVNNILLPSTLTSVEKANQSHMVSGTITDSSGFPLPGANVLEKGTNNGVQTDFDGKFFLNTKNENVVLKISYVGYITQEVEVKWDEEIMISLVEDTASLDEVVLIGYGSQKKSDLTGATSQISAKDFEKQPMVSVDQALQGRLAGVQVTQNNGVPGSGFKIRVRGANSFSSNNPLYVVDGFIGASTSNLAPEDIESVNVLKDASATAIYGNRASGGVVIITTKKGKEGKNKIDFSSFISVAKPIGEFELLDAATFAELANRKSVEQGGSDIYTSEEINDFEANGGTDWQDELFQTSITNNYQLALSGGGSGISYYVSANHADQEGLIRNTDYKRYGLRANVSAKLNDKLDVDFSSNYTRNVSRNGTSSTSTSGTGNLMARALTFDPTTPVYDENGDYNLLTINNVASQGQNPVFLADVADATTYRNYLQSRLALNYNIVKNLDFNISMGANTDDSNYREFVDEDVQNGNTAISTVVNAYSYQNINRLTYKNLFNDKHSLSVDAIYEQSASVSRYTSAYAEDFANTVVGSEDLALGSNALVGSGTTKSSLRSFIGRVTYGFNDKYLFTGSIRSDESSKFVNDPVGVFPSFSLGWNISKEDFFQDISVISNLKIRGGWGVTGNQNVDTQASYSFLNTGSSFNYIFGDAISSGGISVGIGSATQDSNPDLTWEETTQTNIGLDFGLFNGAINGSFEYYNKQTEGLLMERDLPNYTGLLTQYVNAASVENKGYEMSITAYPITNKDFSWEISANFSSNKNKVLELVDDLDQIALGGDYNSFDGEVTIAKIGESLGSFYGYQYTGPDSTTGEATYKDFNEDGVVDSDDKIILGNGNPDFIFGINNTFSYKGINLNIFVQALEGNEIYNSIGTTTYGWGAGSRNTTNPGSLNSWTTTNTDTNIPSLNSAIRSVSSFSVEDGSFIRLKNISLGYTLPSHLLEPIGVSLVKIYVSGQNLITWTDYSGFDPEVSSGGGSDIDPGVDNGVFPNTKTITLGFNANF